MDTVTIGLVIGASVIVQLVLLGLHRLRGEASGAPGMLAAGLALLGGGAALMYAFNRPYTLMLSVSAAGLLMAGYALSMAALGAAATGSGKFARRLTEATVVFWLVHLLAKVYDPGGLAAGLVELLFIAVVSAIQAFSILRVRLPSPLTLVSGIACALVAMASAAVCVPLVLAGPGSFVPLGFEGAAGIGFIFQQAIFGATVLLA